MDRLISANAFKKFYCDECKWRECENNGSTLTCGLVRDIDNQPTVNAMSYEEHFKAITDLQKRIDALEDLNAQQAEFIRRRCKP